MPSPGGHPSQVSSFPPLRPTLAVSGSEERWGGRTPTTPPACSEAFQMGRRRRKMGPGGW